VTAAMSTRDLESDAIVLLRLARVYLGRDTVSVHIDATGVAITVATEAAAHRLAEAHGLRRAGTSLAADMGRRRRRRHHLRPHRPGTPPRSARRRVNDYKLPNGKALVLRTCERKDDGTLTGHGNFPWPAEIGATVGSARLEPRNRTAAADSTASSGGRETRPT
jgi:hypothetical protein